MDSPHNPQVRVTVHTQQHRPVTPQKSLDSLEQILDTTEETVEEESSEEVIEETGRKDGWVDEPYLQQEERAGYLPQQHTHQQHQYPANLDPSYMTTPVSQLTTITLLEDSDDGTNTTATPSEKALRAAETLKESFAKRRRQRAANISTETIIPEEEQQFEDDDLE